APLREPLFRALWIAALISNIGTWMEDVGESWLMMSLSHSPLLVALLQTTDAIPIILLSLPSGALADVMDRRRLLLLTQTWMSLAPRAPYKRSASRSGAWRGSRRSALRAPCAGAAGNPLSRRGLHVLRQRALGAAAAGGAPRDGAQLDCLRRPARRVGARRGE